MQTASTLFERELRKLIAERRKTLVENVTSGLAINSIEDYRSYTGKIAGLDEVLDMIEDAARTVDKML